MQYLKDARGYILIATLMVAFLFAANVSAGDQPKGYASKATATQYLIQVPHTTEECLKALDETKAQGAENLNQWSWGCKFGNHTGYAIVNAESESEALAFVPAAERSKAKVYPLAKFSVQEIEAFHSMHQ
jgi:hypothetical protein